LSEKSSAKSTGFKILAKMPDTFWRIEASQVFLRPIERDDLPRIAAWHRDRGLFELLVGPYRDIPEAEAIHWMEVHWLNDPEQLRMAICLRSGGRHIGNIYLLQLDRVYLNAELSIFVGSGEDRRRGYGREAIELMLGWAFRVEGLHRIYLEVLSSNIAARSLYRKCGFRAEGVSREAALKGGQWVDIVRMAIIDWQYKMHKDVQLPDIPGAGFSQ
jgi:RimJ/RimL family protein N-acetyltransferase